MFHPRIGQLMFRKRDCQRATHPHSLQRRLPFSPNYNTWEAEHALYPIITPTLFYIKLALCTRLVLHNQAELSKTYNILLSRPSVVTYCNKSHFA